MLNYTLKKFTPARADCDLGICNFYVFLGDNESVHNWMFSIQIKSRLQSAANHSEWLWDRRAQTQWQHDTNTLIANVCVSSPFYCVYVDSINRNENHLHHTRQSNAVCLCFVLIVENGKHTDVTSWRFLVGRRTDECNQLNDVLLSVAHSRLYLFSYIRLNAMFCYFSVRNFVVLSRMSSLSSATKSHKNTSFDWINFIRSYFCVVWFSFLHFGIVFISRCGRKKSENFLYLFCSFVLILSSSQFGNDR